MKLFGRRLALARLVSAGSVVLGIAASLTSLARADSQYTTTGNCSSIIANVEAGASVTTNCYDFDPNAPKFRVTYYNMGGIAPNLLVEGVLARNWEKFLGGQQAIIQNSVFAGAKKFLTQYSTDFHGEVVRGADVNALPEDDLSLGQGGPPKRLVGYLGGLDSPEVLFRDDEAISTLLNTDDWPEDYNAQYTKASLTEDGRFGSVKLWRYLRLSDLSNSKFELDDTTLAVSLTDDELSAFIASIKSISSQELPDGFLTVVGDMRDPAHADLSWQFSVNLREFQLVLCVIENVSKSAISIGDFQFKQYALSGPVEESSTDAELDNQPSLSKKLYPFAVLKPSEKIIVPLRMQLRLRSDEIDDALGRDPDAKLEIPTKSEVQAWVDHRRTTATEPFAVHWMSPETYQSFADYAADQLKWNQEHGERYKNMTPEEKAALSPEERQFYEQILAGVYLPAEGPPEKTEKSRLLLPTTPEIPEIFNFGTAWKILGIDVDGKNYPFRQYDANEFMLIAGFEGGTCPYVRVFQPDTQTWSSLGPIIVGAVGKSKQRKEAKELRDFKGLVQLAELENETTVLDQIYISVADDHGNEVKVFPRYQTLREEDGMAIYLNQGDDVTLDFRSDEKLWRDKPVKLVVSGYYTKAFYLADKQVRHW